MAPVSRPRRPHPCLLCLRAWRHGVLSTSVHGVNTVLFSDHTSRVFWIAPVLAVLVSSVVCTLLLYTFSLENSVLTTARFRYSDDIFPDVTLCSLSPISRRVQEILKKRYANSTQVSPPRTHSRLLPTSNATSTAGNASVLPTTTPSCVEQLATVCGFNRTWCLIPMEDPMTFHDAQEACMQLSTGCYAGRLPDKFTGDVLAAIDTTERRIQFDGPNFWTGIQFNGGVYRSMETSSVLDDSNLYTKLLNDKYYDICVLYDFHSKLYTSVERRGCGKRRDVVCIIRSNNDTGDEKPEPDVKQYETQVFLPWESTSVDPTNTKCNFALCPLNCTSATEKWAYVSSRWCVAYGNGSATREFCDDCPSTVFSRLRHVCFSSLTGFFKDDKLNDSELARVCQVHPSRNLLNYPYCLASFTSPPRQATNLTSNSMHLHAMRVAPSHIRHAADNCAAYGHRLPVLKQITVREQMECIQSILLTERQAVYLCAYRDSEGIMRWCDESEVKEEYKDGDLLIVTAGEPLVTAVTYEQALDYDMITVCEKTTQMTDMADIPWVIPPCSRSNSREERTIPQQNFQETIANSTAAETTTTYPLKATTELKHEKETSQQENDEKQAKLYDSLVPYGKVIEEFESSKNMLWQCKYGNYSCSISDFQPHYAYGSGICYTLPSSKMHSIQSGEQSALNIFGFVNISDFSDDVKIYHDGLRVLLHTRGQPIFPDKDGYYAASGFHTSFATSHQQLTRLRSGGCVDSSDEVPFYLYEGKYNYESCLRSCEQYTMRACGCSDPRLAPNPSYAFCESGVELDCIKELRKIFDARLTRGETVCPHCRPPCSESTFDNTVASARQLIDPFHLNQSNLHSIQISVFLHHRVYMVVTETNMMRLEQLLSSLGNFIGMFLGMSVISAIESVFLLLICGNYAESRLLYRFRRHQNIIKDIINNPQLSRDEFTARISEKQARRASRQFNRQPPLKPSGMEFPRKVSRINFKITNKSSATPQGAFENAFAKELSENFVRNQFVLRLKHVMQNPQRIKGQLEQLEMEKRRKQILKKRKLQGQITKPSRRLLLIESCGQQTRH